MPKLLVATHLYFPLSVLFTFVMLSSFLSDDNLILISLTVTADSFLVQVNVGPGMPFASLEKVIFSPSLHVRGTLGCVVNAGCSIRSKYM